VRVALDTNRLIDLFRGDSDLADWLGTCTEVWLPFIVLGEIMAGFYGGSRRHRNEGLLQALLAKPTVGVSILASRQPNITRGCSCN
jgi:predicted nucleic acid-binding protein